MNCLSISHHFFFFRIDGVIFYFRIHPNIWLPILHLLSEAMRTSSMQQGEIPRLQHVARYCCAARFLFSVWFCYVCGYLFAMSAK